MKISLFFLLSIISFGYTYANESISEKIDSYIIIKMMAFKDINSELKMSERSVMPTDSFGYIFGKFINASMVEGSVGLHFIDVNTREDISFYYFDIDPVKEGLFNYVENEESIFPDLVTNPQIKGVTLKIYWELEYFQADLTDYEDYYKVLKKIERIK